MRVTEAHASMAEQQLIGYSVDGYHTMSYTLHKYGYLSLTRGREKKSPKKNIFYYIFFFYTLHTYTYIHAIYMYLLNGCINY